jgi:hypothetical protein
LYWWFDFIDHLHTELVATVKPVTTNSYNTAADFHTKNHSTLSHE